MSYNPPVASEAAGGNGPPEIASSTKIVVMDGNSLGSGFKPVEVFSKTTMAAEATVAAAASEAVEAPKSAGVPMPLISWTSSHQSDKANSSCVQLANEHETQLKNLTLVNILILVVLLIVFIANAREGECDMQFNEPYYRH